jgi:hypothetical protein
MKSSKYFSNFVNKIDINDTFRGIEINDKDQNENENE